MILGCLFYNCLLPAPILATKLYIPLPRSQIVLRPYLMARLNAGLHHRLVLICAPAGFGKTTLISEWVQAIKGATTLILVAWLSLDEEDKAPTRFLAYLVAAEQTVSANLGAMVLAVRAPSHVCVSAANAKRFSLRKDPTLAMRLPVRKGLIQAVCLKCSSTRKARRVFQRLGPPVCSISKCVWPGCLACTGQVRSMRRFCLRRSRASCMRAS